jgi:lysyl-tRNA synthetase, class II
MDEGPRRTYPFDEGFLTKLDQLRESGVDPYPSGLRVTHTAGELREAHGHLGPATELDDTDAAIGGRVLFRNRMGRALFLRILDRTGAIQIYARREEIGDETFDLLKGIDIGDWVWARGKVMTTRTGELSVQAREARLAAKVLTPFPDRWHGLHDVETRSRQRYVDLFMNEETREVFRRRSKIVSLTRRFFEEREFLEVETPMMQVLAGGATARPFVTHHNALDIDLYLRVAPELYLKRLVVGGFERVFEINKNFRNEGISPKHNPEFTMLEFYQAWATWEDLADLTETLFASLARAVCGATRIRFGEHEIELAPPYRRASMEELVREATGLSAEAVRDPAQLAAWCGAEAGPGAVGIAGWWERIYDEHVEPRLIQPTFVTHHPTEISPLSRRNDADPTVVDRFELVVAGRELANAFSELADPVDQAERFAAQARARAAGDEESMLFDDDYVRALTYGLPPTAGEGIGIDRLVMLLTDRTSIREVILFPTLRPERPAAESGTESGAESDGVDGAESHRAGAATERAG